MTTATANQIAQLQASIARVIRGKDEVIRLAIVALLAKGHLLIEDVPGVGKTTLAQALANSFHCSFQRIQFTSDLLPSDVVGTSVFNQIEQRFDFKPGPIFANIILADEINRTTPKTQSALLEAMNEAQVTVDNHTHKLPQPFMVLATQNPVEHHGTYPLPESQLDRFLLRIGMGYPSRESEREIMRQHTGGRNAAAEVTAVMEADDVEMMQRAVEKVRVDDSLRDYAIDIVERTRTHRAAHSRRQPARLADAAARGAGAGVSRRPRILHAGRFQAAHPAGVRAPRGGQHALRHDAEKIGAGGNDPSRNHRIHSRPPLMRARIRRTPRRPSAFTQSGGNHARRSMNGCA